MNNSQFDETRPMPKCSLNDKKESDSCKSKEIYINSDCPSPNSSNTKNKSTKIINKSTNLTSSNLSINKSTKKSNSTSSLGDKTDRSDMQNLHPPNLSNNQYLSSNQLNQQNAFFQPNYNQMNIQNNSLNFRHSPPNQYMNLDQTSQMTNYYLSNNVNNLNLNSPSPTSNHSFNNFNNFNDNQLNLDKLPTRYSPTSLNASDRSRTDSPSFPAYSNAYQSQQQPNHIKDPKELTTFNFQNRSHIHGFQNNFEPEPTRLNESLNQDKNDYPSDSYNEFSDLDDDKNRNKFLSPSRPQLPMSNVDLSTNNFSTCAPRTGSASPISSYNSPAVAESRIKKNKFNFKMRKFKIKGKKSSTKQSKKSNKSQKSKKPGLLYSQLNISGNLNSINKMQLSILNTGLIRIESDKASTIIAKEPFNLSTNKFIEHLELLRKYNVLFKIEYFVACKTENHSFQHALKPENEIKNCNKKLLPYDYNRVVLETIPSVLCSDYINASHIDSILKPKAYIASQGPVEETIDDFWRMVYEQGSHIIVMLTKVFDFIRVMCSQYWPLDCNKAKMYGQIEVTLLTEEPLADFQIRTFKIRKIENSESKGLGTLSPLFSNTVNESTKKPATDSNDKENKDEVFNSQTPSYKKLNSENDEYRIVYQFAYEKWPTHSCPYATSILQFRRRVRIFMKELLKEEKNLGPVIVHCGDGGGRTGCYLAIDANLEYAKEDHLYDVFNYAKKLRNQRRNLIEGVDQYKFVYEVLEEAHKSGKTWFPVSELQVKMKFKSIKDPVTKINEYQREYDKILKVTPKFTIGDCAGGHRVENRSKNRDVLTIPPDNHRPYLTTFPTNDSTDYVNGIFVDGYTRSKEYIITEWPMQDTIPDCWSLIYDHNCNSVVVLVKPEDNSTYPPFWPLEKREERKYGPAFTIECISFNHYTNIKCWLIKIHKKVCSLNELMSGVKGEPKMTQLFQITCWPESQAVPSSTNAIVELMNMVERWRQRTQYGPVIVISSDGCSRAGVYCAANVAIEQVVQHREVDVFQAVKTVRRHRPFLVQNLTEYKYCYDLILTYCINYLKPESH